MPDDGDDRQRRDGRTEPRRAGVKGVHGRRFLGGGCVAYGSDKSPKRIPPSEEEAP
jgi:hypothetical protein